MPRHRLCEKVHFTRAMNFAMSMMPGGLDGMGFWPRTWIIPLELEELKEAVETSINQWWSDGGDRRKTQPPMWIVKPESGMQGDDIFFVDSSVAAAAFLPRYQIRPCCGDFSARPLGVTPPRVPARAVTVPGPRLLSLSPPQPIKFKFFFLSFGSESHAGPS